MKEKLTTFDRRIEMLFFLLNNKKSTISELAQMFSVAQRTAYADIVSLSRYAPIYTRLGNNGGVYLLEDYKNKLFIYLSFDEEQVLLKSLKSATPKEQLVIKGILNKYSMPKLSV